MIYINEINLKIGFFLDGKDIIKLKHVKKYFNNLLSFNNTYFWNKKLDVSVLNFNKTITLKTKNYVLSSNAEFSKFDSLYIGFLKKLILKNH